MKHCKTKALFFHVQK